MPEAVRVTVLLANEDTLHRDGLCAVLGANAELDVVLACDDGYVALDEIRRLRPEVAVVDLNLDGLAGIDVVRRVRAERLSTKIIILSARVDDDTVREAMQSGADGYVLKDGPARHLTDAIFYVRDGGRYLSPTLTTERRSSSRAMAGGARPVPNRREPIERRGAEKKRVEKPPAADYGSPAGLPQLIDEAVSERFQSVAGKLQAEIEEQHVRMLEVFVRNIQGKLVQRVSALEENIRQQAEAVHELRGFNQRTEGNLTRLIAGVDKLAKEAPRVQAAVQRPKKAKNLKAGIFWCVIGLSIVCAVAYEIYPAKAPVVQAGGNEIQTARQTGDVPLAGADPKTKMEAAGRYKDRREYGTAERLYKEVLEAQPQNADALKGLASVLYREDKIEESAAVLERLPKN